MNEDRILDVYEGRVGNPSFQRAARARVHWLCSQVTGEHVLDVGCSQGIASILLAREGHRVLGIDRERAAIARARERLLEETEVVRGRVEFLLEEATRIAADDAAFDSVLLGEVLEHQVDPWPVVDESLRVVRPGGRVVITVPYGFLRYHDHKAPIMLLQLLDGLRARCQVRSVELVGRYLGIVAARAVADEPRSNDDVWRQALTVAERRIGDIDRTLDEERRRAAALKDRIGELRAALDALRTSEAERRDALLTAREQRARLEVELEDLRRELAEAITERSGYSAS